MKLPFKPSLMKTRHKKPKFIVLHHTVCQYPQPEARIDKTHYQTQFIMNGVLEQKTPDINYHFIIEKIKEDYVPLTARPFVYECVFPDIDTYMNRFSLHVALLGSYDFKIPEKRLYEVTAYKVINPLMKMFALTPSRLKLHSEISSDKDQTCPGDFFDMERLITEVRRFLIK